MPLITSYPAATSSASAGGFGNSVYPTSTWSTLPAASASAGVIFRVTDIGITGAGLVVISDGTVWAPLGGQVFARSAVAASVTGTTSETMLATVTIPAGAMGLNGGLIVYSTWTTTNSANNKTMRTRLGGIGGTAFFAAVQTAVASFNDLRRIRNRGSAASQVTSSAAAAGSPVGASTAALTTGVIDTTLAQDLVFTGQLALGSETLTLESYEVWLLP